MPAQIIELAKRFKRARAKEFTHSQLTPESPVLRLGYLDPNQAPQRLTFISTSAEPWLSLTPDQKEAFMHDLALAMRHVGINLEWAISVQSASVKLKLPGKSDCSLHSPEATESEA